MRGGRQERLEYKTSEMRTSEVTSLSRAVDHFFWGMKSNVRASINEERYTPDPMAQGTVVHLSGLFDNLASTTVVPADRPAGHRFDAVLPLNNYRITQCDR